MPPLTLDELRRSARRLPVTTAFIGVTLAVNALILLGVVHASSFVLQSSFSHLYPWGLVTYVVAVPCWIVLYVPAYVALFATWGAAVETALGSTEYAIYVLFTTVVTAMSVFVLDYALFYPVGTLTGGVDVRDYRAYEPERGRRGVDGDMNRFEAIDHGEVKRWRYLYWGVWPAAYVVVFALCRCRGSTAPVGPSWYGKRLVLQRVPLALLACAATLDLIQWCLCEESSIDYYGHVRSRSSGWNCVVAAISMFAAWLYERHASSDALTLDTFFYPASVRGAVRKAGEVTYASLRPTRFGFLLPPREGAGGGGDAATMPLPVFAAASTPATMAASDGSTLLPGTTAEEAERYRLIAREALARRLQEQRQLRTSSTAVPGEEAAVSVHARTPSPRPVASPASERTEEIEVDGKTA